MNYFHFKALDFIFKGFSPPAHAAPSTVQEIVQTHVYLVSLGAENFHRCFSVYVNGIFNLVSFVGKDVLYFLQGIFLLFGTNTAPPTRIKIANAGRPTMTARALNPQTTLRIFIFRR